MALCVVHINSELFFCSAGSDGDYTFTHTFFLLHLLALSSTKILEAALVHGNTSTDIAIDDI